MPGVVDLAGEVRYNGEVTSLTRVFKVEDVRARARCGRKVVNALSLLPLNNRTNRGFS
jgi:hypothetical protein